MEKENLPFGGFLDSFSSLFGGGDGSFLGGSSNPLFSGNGNSLDKLATNVNQLVMNGKIDPLVGREKEIDEMILYLNRRRKNNPVLIGDPGVGKTAIVHGLAQRIVNGEVPKNLKNKIIYSLNVNDLVAGTSFRGQFEERVNKIVDSCKNNPDIILFIDELHTIMGAGSVSDSKGDLANILKPSLANGDIQIIGATTTKEFDEIEKDGAMERRLQKILVKEPSKEETLEILKGLTSTYSKHHNVNYSDEVLETIVNFADRYIFYRNMPDKAIDLLDSVGSFVSIQHISDSNLSKEILEKYNDLLRKENEALEARNFELAFNYKTARENLGASFEKENKIDISTDDVKSIVEKITNIPVQDVDNEGKVSLLNVELELGKDVMGQRKAVETVAKSIKRNRVNIRNTKKPSSFLFAGPTGVGKTELAKSIAKFILRSEKSLIRFDMSEYMEDVSVAKLIGASPGYVGYDEGGKLTNAVKNNPYSVILFDEIEKAHPKVYNIFLQILDDGILTDGKGKLVDFSNAVIIFTSNIGTTGVKHTGFAPASVAGHFEDAVKHHFKPEFVNRLDAVVSFENLEKESLHQIFDKLVQPILDGLSNYNFVVTISDEVKDWIIEKGYSKTYGARFLNRVIVEHIEDVLTDYIINTKKPVDSVFVLNEEKTKTVLSPMHEKMKTENIELELEQ